MKIERYAAIDIGSNAVRVLISNVVVSPGTQPKYMKMKAFKLIMKVNNVKKYMACATSALREANNASEVIKEVKKKTGIEIQVIDGKREAEIIATTNIFESINKNRTFLFIDVGGGSTEFSVLVKGERVVSKSFKVGTVRMINNMVSEKVWEEIKVWVGKTP